MAPKTRQATKEAKMVRQKLEKEEEKKECVKQEQALEDLQRPLPNSTGEEEEGSTQMSTILKATTYIDYLNEILKEPQNVHTPVLEKTVPNIVYLPNHDARNSEEFVIPDSDAEHELNKKILKRAKHTIREKNRIHRVNEAFDDLRDCLPHNSARKCPKTGKLSKIDTLKQAIAYIADLNEILREAENIEPMDIQNSRYCVGCQGAMENDRVGNSSWSGGSETSYFSL